MTKGRKYESLLTAVLVGECSEKEQSQFDTKVEEDESFRAEYLQLQNTIQIVDQNQRTPDPGDEFWDNVWSDFQNTALAAEHKSHNWSPKIGSVAWDNFWRPAMQIGVVAAMLLIGIFIGIQITGQEVQQIGLPQLSEQPLTELPAYAQRDIQEGSQQMMMNVAENSIDRSSKIIDEFMEFQPSDENVAQWQTFGQKREEMLSLSDELMFIRTDTSDPRIVQISPVIEELEIFMGELATIDYSLVDIKLEVKMIQEVIRDSQLKDRINEIKITIRSSGVKK